MLIAVAPVVVRSPVLVVMPSRVRAVVATFMPTVPAIPVFCAVLTPVAIAVPIVMLAGMPTMMPVVVLGAGASGRADGEQHGAHQRYRGLEVPSEDVVHARAPIGFLIGGQKTPYERCRARSNHSLALRR